MIKKLSVAVSVVMALLLSSCGLFREIDTTPAVSVGLDEQAAIEEVASSEQVKTYAIAESTVDTSILSEETDLALMKLYAEQKTVDEKKALEKKQQADKKNAQRKASEGNGSANSGGQGSGNSGSSDSGSWVWTAPAAPDVSAYTASVVNIVNSERASAGLGGVTATAELNAAAQKRAEEIVSSFSHSRPDGRSCFTVLDEYGVSYMACGENIAAGQSSPEAVMNAWMNSEGHRSNILGSGYSHIGVGLVYRDGGYGYYWVQLFTN